MVEAAGPESRLSVGERVCSLHWAQDLGWPAPFDSEAAMQSFIGLLCDGGYAEYAAGHHRYRRRSLYPPPVTPPSLAHRPSPTVLPPSLTLAPLP